VRRPSRIRFRPRKIDHRLPRRLQADDVEPLTLTQRCLRERSEPRSGSSSCLMPPRLPPWDGVGLERDDEGLAALAVDSSPADHPRLEAAAVAPRRRTAARASPRPAPPSAPRRRAHGRANSIRTDRSLPCLLCDRIFFTRTGITSLENALPVFTGVWRSASARLAGEPPLGYRPRLVHGVVAIREASRYAAAARRSVGHEFVGPSGFSRHVEPAARLVPDFSAAISAARRSRCPRAD